MAEHRCWISVLPLAQVTPMERHNEILILIPIPVEYLLDIISACAQSP